MKSRKGLFGLLMTTALGLGGCSTFENMNQGAKPREFQVRKLWVRSATEQQNKTHRKINRMTPLLTGDLLLTGNSIDGMVAYDRESGQEKWRLKVVNGVEGGAALIRDRLFFGGSDGNFYSVNAKSGTVEWTFPTRAEILSEPLLDLENGLVYLLTSTNVVHALEADSGKPLWVFSRQDANQFSIRGGTKPVLHKGLLYVGFSDGFLTALDAKTGQARWESQLNRNKKFKDVDTNPVLDGDRLYVAGFDDKLYCLSADKGDILWRVDGGGFFGVTVAGQRIYYPTSQGELKALDRESGKLIWSILIPDGIATTVIPYQGVLVFGESRGFLRFIEPVEGKRLAGFEPGRGVFSTPQVDEKNRRLYFISGEANVYALEAGWANVDPFASLQKPKGFE